jgi:ABC-type multidrug transport system ATPase subunit/pSer/pThr/pTyr-binding forkhead associated (FHA) protein
VAGSGANCDIVVAGATVSGRHCKLTFVDGVYTLEDLGSTNGTYVDGEKILAPTVVRPGQHITLGRNTPLPWPSSEERIPSPLRTPGTTIRIGRDLDNDVVLSYPTISGHHARILVGSDEIVIEDLGSTNGTAINSWQNKVRRGVLKPDDRVFFGSYPVPAARLLSKQRHTIGATPQQTLIVSRDHMSLGRDPECDFPLPYPSISWRHAELTRTPAGMEVRDLRSLNGTFVNGVRVTGSKPLAPGDVLSLGSITLQLGGTGELHRRDYEGNVTIEVEGLGVSAQAAGSELLLEDVHFTVFPSEIVALMGPSGAGKTTLLKALNGYTIPSAGAVLFNGHNLYAAFDTYRLELGYVPQDDIIHPLLTVREALYFTAKLRTDLREEEIERRIGEVLQTLDISGIQDKLIGSPERKVISGGQRKRVNIAMELLCDPTVLFLDEPTSGLASSDSLKVIQHLHRLAQSGKTVLLTIHQPSTTIFRLFDDLILISRDSKDRVPPGTKPGPGRLVYFGPAYPESVEFFHPQAVAELQKKTPGAEPSPDLLFEGLEAPAATTADWAARYEASPYKREYVDERRGAVHSTEQRSPRSGPRFQTGQIWSLMRRNYLLKLRDRLQTGILLLQAPGFAFLVWLAFGRLAFDPATGDRDWVPFSTNVSSIHFLMIVAALWFGCNNAVREVVGEWAVFEREQMAGLKIWLYLFSKVQVLGGLCVLQCLSLLTIIYFGCGLQGSFWRIFVVLLLSSLIGVSVGLGISSHFRTTDSALAMLPLVLLPMIVLGGGMQPISTMNGAAQAVSLAIPSRWGYEANVLAEARAQPVYSFNPCRPALLKAQASAHDAVAKVRTACEETLRAQERAMRDKLGVLAPTLMPSTPRRPAPAEAQEPPLPEPPAQDIAEASFPSSAASQAAFLSFLAPRSPYWLSVTVLGAMHILLLAAAYAMLRARVLH